MHRLASLRFVLLVTGLIQSLASAQGPKPPLPEGATILDRHVEATGGKKAHLAVTRRKSTGKLLIDMAGHKFEARVETQEKAPGFSHKVIDSSVLSQVIVSDGKHAWQWTRGHDGTGKTQLLEGEKLARTLDAAVLHANTNWRKHFAKVETKRVVERDGKPAYEVEVTTKRGRTYKRYYDQESGRLAGYTQTIELYGGKTEMDVTIGDYRKVDDVWLPMRVHAVLNSSRYGKGTQTWVYSKIEHGRKISQKLFEMPPEVAELAAKAEAKAEGASKSNDKR